jgi:hypothetical protein
MMSVDAKERYGRVGFPYSETLKPIAQQICEVTIISAGNLSACPCSIMQRVSPIRLVPYLRRLVLAGVGGPSDAIHYEI